ncbi:hypothetical protein HY095_02175 [Candidatus Micrarchaeota archaeon]|nr:hypothetical protein [Candidatus Micrarchaeota archaeon]
MATGATRIFLQNRQVLSALLYLYHYNPDVPMAELSEGTGVEAEELSQVLNLSIKFNLAEIRPSGEVSLIANRINSGTLEVRFATSGLLAMFHYLCNPLLPRGESS